nr:immunoglobulin light chain junction region [Macaca mulatta]
CQQGHTNPLTF